MKLYLVAQILLWSLLLLFRATEQISQEEDAGFEQSLVRQKNQSFQYILQNIGGALSILDPNEVSPGVVIASPLRTRPNYFYNWIRDSALVMRTLIVQLDEDTTGNFAFLKTIIENYIEESYHLQRLPNRSGMFDDSQRSGLGEPKFMADGKTFDDDWGRPQSDGPGLRAVTIIDYLHLLERHNETLSSNFLGNSTFVYHEIVKPDLDYVIAHWAAEAFDLWEEINALHFFNSLTMLRALVEGRRFATEVGESDAFIDALSTTFDSLKSLVTDASTGFAPETLLHIVETPKFKQLGIRGGLDAATLLAALHSHEIGRPETETIPFDVDDHRILNTLLYMVSDMKYRYPINNVNSLIQQNGGVGLGRYPEDLYDGYGTSEGNPWFIATASAAEVALYRKQDLVISANNRKFFATFCGAWIDQMAPDDSKTLAYGSQEYSQVISAMFSYANNFLKVVMSHVDTNNHRMLEQFNKYTGYMQGAEDLTWSYSSFYNCARWRFKVAELVKGMDRTTDA
ncbi:Six-hairpin glycosidase [Metschnikowia bicuspidata]|uniref:glucan 1,4-alpha-glucosidase n=1 Tax=Metschnikowia bicuspidata TaxID=27322 RepID=A0A4P9ZB14_9ASCO|nr:Six-hairpin glycosidase [Metschnikowia bicuspidata]